MVSLKAVLVSGSVQVQGTGPLYQLCVSWKVSVTSLACLIYIRICDVFPRFGSQGNYKITEKYNVRDINNLCYKKHVFNVIAAGKMHSFRFITLLDGF